MHSLKNNAKKIIKTALAEDIGSGDITTDDLFLKDRKIKAHLLAKQEMVLAGSWVFEEVFKSLGGKLKFRWLKEEGDKIKKNVRFCIIEGSLKNLLKGERVALNFLQRLSGIATLTAQFVNKVKKTKTVILDTRKTTPGLRLIEKYAVKAGGAKNHRMGLYDSYLIKDNHIEPFGSVRKTLMELKKRRKKKPVEIETKNIKEVKEALDMRADIIMLDNMTVRTIKKALKLIRGRAKTEISGGVNLNNIEKYAKIGVDFISVGALTHSPASMDISLIIK